MSRFVLKLYVAGRTPRTESAISSLKEICDRDLSGLYELSVIDVLERPQLAEREDPGDTDAGQGAAPAAQTRRRGDLSDRERVLVGLDLAVREMGQHEVKQ